VSGSLRVLPLTPIRTQSMEKILRLDYAVDWDCRVVPSVINRGYEHPIRTIIPCLSYGFTAKRFLNTKDTKYTTIK
jgi:hypothetical protein